MQTERKDKRRGKCFAPKTWTERADTNEGDTVSITCGKNYTCKTERVFVSDKKKELNPRRNSSYLAIEVSRLSCDECKKK